MMILVTLLFLTIGCTHTLDIKYDFEMVRKGPLSSIRSLNIVIEEFKDERPSKKIFVSPFITGNIILTKSVPQIVRDALIVEFSKNGHLVINDNDNSFTLSGTITAFCTEVKRGVWGDKSIGTININLNVINNKTSALVFKRAYDGYYEKKGQGTRLDYIMNKTLENMMRQMSTDIELIQVLKNF
jgi:hypothetical protein